MKSLFCLSIATVLLSTSAAMSQPPGGRGPGGGPPGGGPPPGQGGRGEQGGRQSNPIIAAIDSDGDHVISAKEIMAAATALKKLDRNRDGKLTSDEIHGGEGGRGQGGRGGEGGRGGGRGRGEAGGPGGPGGGPPQGEGGPGGPPTAERFMDHAMTFDADKDGKLDKAELRKMAAAVVEEMGRRGGPPGDRGGPRGGEGGRRGGNREGGGDRKRPAIEE